MRKDMTVEYGESFIRVGKPVVDAFIKASGTSVVLLCVPVDGYVLISFEVNGTVIARRELFEMVEGSVTVGDYTIAYESGVVTISTTASNDIVDIRIEPVDVVISDAFRAAVNETAPQTPNELPDVSASDKGKFLHVNESTGELEWAEGGGSGGGALVVTDTNGTLNKTWQEIHDAMLSGGAVISATLPDRNMQVLKTEYDSKRDEYDVHALYSVIYAASSASGYPECKSNS